MLDHQLARDVRVLVHLTSHLFIGEKLAMFGNLGAEDIELVRDYVGNRVMTAFSKGLKPQHLKKMVSEADKPHIFFLLAFGVAVALGYNIGTVCNEP